MNNGCWRFDVIFCESGIKVFDIWCCLRIWFIFFGCYKVSGIDRGIDGSEVGELDYQVYFIDFRRWNLFWVCLEYFFEDGGDVGCYLELVGYVYWLVECVCFVWFW